MDMNLLQILDRYLVWFSAGVAVFFWMVAELLGASLGPGTQAALGTWVAMAALKSKTDQRWRALEVDRQETRALVEALDKVKPGSDESLVLRKELVERAKRILNEGD